MQATKEQVNAVLVITEAVIDAVCATPEGVPGGTIYAALSANGASLQQYDQIMGIAMESGRIRKVGELYFPAGEE